MSVGSGLYKYRVELFNEWMNSDDRVTLEFEMWLVDRLKRKSDALEFAKGLLAAERNQNNDLKEIQKHLEKDVE